MLPIFSLSLNNSSFTRIEKFIEFYLLNIILAVGLVVCLFGFYGISNIVGYLMPNSFLYK